MLRKASFIKIMCRFIGSMLIISVLGISNI